MAPTGKTRITCAGCKGIVTSGQCLTCCLCKQKYDLLCANVTEEQCRSASFKKNWKCQECTCKERKSGNVNTPIQVSKALVHTVRSGSPSSDSEGGEEDNVTGCSTVTHRKQHSSTAVKKAPKVQSRLEEHDDDLKDPTQFKQILQAIRSELPSMFKEILRAELSTIRGDLQDLRKSVDFVNEMYDTLQKSVEGLTKDNAQLKAENRELKSTVCGFSDRLNNLEQHLRENNLEFHGVPEHGGENLRSLVQQCSRVINCKINDDDLITCTRVAKLNRESKLPRTVVVKFKTVRHRDEFYSAVTRYNKQHADDKLNTSVLGMGGPRKPVYISEHLSPANKLLHASARKRASENGYRFVWIRNGRIYVRKDQGSALIHIKNNDSLQFIK